MKPAGYVTRKQLIDSYTDGEIEPLAVMMDDRGDHCAIVDALESEDCIHLVMVKLPIAGKASTLVAKIRYFESGRPYIRSRYEYFHLDKFTACSDDWNNIMQEVVDNE